LLTEGHQAYYFTLEEPQLLASFNNHPDNLFDYTSPLQDLADDHRLYVIIDEIQYLANPTNFLKLLFDKYAPKLKLIVTGSSAFYIDRNFKDSLAGRKKIIEMYGLTFSEFLHFKNLNALLLEYKRMQANPKAKSLQEETLRTLFAEYLTYGGYPAVVLEKNVAHKIELLAEIANSYIKKDILEADIKHDLKFYQLLRILAGQVGELTNQNELAGTLKLSAGTIDNYLYLLQKCFHVHLLPPMFTNVRKELTKMPKVFFNDLGLRNYLCRQFDQPTLRIDKGSLLENYVFIRLQQLYGYNDLRFWRTADGNEVDFIYQETAETGKAYEVKFKPSAYKASKYKKFREAYANFPLSVISYDVDTDLENGIDVFKL
jgi:uncharacterized protein